MSLKKTWSMQVTASKQHILPFLDACLSDDPGKANACDVDCPVLVWGSCLIVTCGFISWVVDGFDVDVGVGFVAVPAPSIDCWITCLNFS